MICGNCGMHLPENSNFCTNCGCSFAANYYQQGYTYAQPKEPAPILYVAKVFMIIGIIIEALFLPSLFWTIPMLKSYNRKLEIGEPVSTGFKVCTLLFVSTIAGILMLCDHSDNT